MTKFKGKIVYQVEDTLHNIIIFESFRKRWMTFGNEYIQTAIYKNKPWRPLMDYIVPLCLGLHTLVNPQKILLLGMGGGALIHYLQHNFSQCHITAVEANPQVIDIAQRYFHIKPNQGLSIVNARAEEVVAHTIEHYDAIIIDIFLPDRYPASCASLDFFAKCNLILRDAGLISINMVYQNDIELMNLMENVSSEISKHILSLPIAKSSNIIMHSFKCDNFLELLQQLEQRRLLSQIRWDAKFGIIAKAL